MSQSRSIIGGLGIALGFCLAAYFFWLAQHPIPFQTTNAPHWMTARELTLRGEQLTRMYVGLWGVTGGLSLALLGMAVCLLRRGRAA